MHRIHRHLHIRYQQSPMQLNYCNVTTQYVKTVTLLESGGVDDPVFLSTYQI